MKISYIIPVYKVEKYISECIDSLLSQSYKNFEIILVDDGSPDNCGAICDEYAHKDDRVSVIHKENGGLSDARNVGLEAAKGEYVIFVDSDDFWSDSEALQRLVDDANDASLPDMVAFNIMYYYPSTNEYKKWAPFGKDITEEKDVNKVICALIRTGTLPMSACSKMIKREVLIKSNLRFIKGLIGEDTPWFIDLLQVIKSIKYVDDYIYCYRCEVPGSITHTFNEEKYLQYISTTENLIPTVQNSYLSTDAKNALLSFVAYQFCIAIAQIHLLDGAIKQECTERIKRNMWLLNYTLNPKVKAASFVYKIFGFNALRLLLRLYNEHKRK